MWQISQYPHLVAGSEVGAAAAAGGLCVIVEGLLLVAFGVGLERWLVLLLLRLFRVIVWDGLTGDLSGSGGDGGGTVGVAGTGG